MQTASIELVRMLKFIVEPRGMASSGRQSSAFIARVKDEESRHDSFPTDIAFLHKYGIGYAALRDAMARSEECGVSASQALIAANVMSQSDYYRCVADELELPFASCTPVTGEAFLEHPGSAELDKMSKLVAVDGATRVFHIAPDMNERAPLDALLRRQPSIRSKLRITTPNANLAALEGRSRISLMRFSVSGLRNQWPDLSAKTVISVKQAITLLIVLQMLAISIFYASSAVIVGLHLAATLFYLGCVGVRLYAAVVYKPDDENSLPLWQRKRVSAMDRALPMYTVLVAMYHEAGQVEALVDGLLRIDWPREKLEIKLVCEEDDIGTVDAVRRIIEQKNCSHIQLVCVPAAEPRTKPKALNYALPLCKGRYVVVYDAEDRPDPRQLREAYSTFLQSEDSMVCLQAPLTIHNGDESWLSRLFAIEYSALFDGLLPALAKRKLPFPLGGTSNHFKRAALETVGTWDPYNVTEDADLGMRFARLGFDTATIRSPTYEEAPVEYSVWLKQRTRWFKGWLQTWLVHMRRPIGLARDLGMWGTITFHIMITGMIVSALVHPMLLFFIVEALWRCSQTGFQALAAEPLFWLDLTTVMLGYLTFTMLAWRTLPRRGLSALRKTLWTVPAYWMLLSIAAWRAVWHLMRRPHEWEKTPHRLNSASSALEAENVSTISGLVPDSLN